MPPSEPMSEEGICMSISVVRFVVREFASNAGTPTGDSTPKSAAAGPFLSSLDSESESGKKRGSLLVGLTGASKR